MDKVAVILHAEPGTHDALGRALHALLYTRELKEAGHDVKLIFDGGGTKWVGELSGDDHPLAALFTAVKESGAIAGVCEYCVGAFGGEARDIEKCGLPVVNEYEGHPSVATLIGEGYQVITL